MSLLHLHFIQHNLPTPIKSGDKEEPWEDLDKLLLCSAEQLELKQSAERRSLGAEKVGLYPAPSCRILQWFFYQTLLRVSAMLLY